MNARFRLFCALMMCAPTTVHAQQTVSIPEQIGCSCTLRAERVVTLSDEDGRAGLAGALAIERLRDGRFLVVPSSRPSELLLFDAGGRFLRRIGSSGAGPGEFGSIVGLRIGPADSVFAMDASNGRFAVLDPELRFVRVARLPVTGGWFGITDASQAVILTGIPRPGAEELDRIRVLDASMTPVRAFLRGAPSSADVSVEELRRRMAVSPDGRIAISHYARYSIEIWDISGRHLRTLSRTPALLSTTLAPGSPPRYVESVRYDRMGRVWTVTHVPDARWRESLGPSRDPYGREVVGVGSGMAFRYHDSVVEVVDPERGILMGSIRIDPRVDLISDDGYGASYREDAVGLPYIDIWRFVLVE